MIEALVAARASIFLSSRRRARAAPRHLAAATPGSARGNIGDASATELIPGGRVEAAWMDSNRRIAAWAASASS